MLSAATAALSLLALGASSVKAQRQCDGTPIEAASSMPANYPQAGQIAQILDSDTEAWNLFNASMLQSHPLRSLLPQADISTLPL